MSRKLTLGLTPVQAGIVVAVFVVTLTGALVLAWWFRRRNRQAAE